MLASSPHCRFPLTHPTHTHAHNHHHAHAHRPARAVRDLEGRPLAQRTLSVNQPLRFGGVTAYQTDWSMAALTVRAKGSPLQPPDGSAFNLPMASLAGKPGAWSHLGF